MKISMLFRLLFCMFAATTFLAVGAFAQSAAGQIRAAKVEGQVTKVQADGTTTPLKNGDSLTETDSVVTGKNSSVVLVFANGSSVKVGADSRLGIDEFKMDPLDEEIKPSELKQEKSVSQTKLNLAYGEMVGSVKKLNTASSYSVKTPVGAAGIRGTVFRVTFRQGADGKALFAVSTAEGKVVLEGVTSNEIPVDAGNEVLVDVDTDDPANPKVLTQDLPPATKALIESASQTITDALKDVVLPPGEGSTPPAGQQQQQDPTNAAPDLTPGAGNSH
jgi:hypothetical protein